MDRPASAATLRIEPYGSDGPRWVVGRAAAELIARYGGLDDGELGLTSPKSSPEEGGRLARMGSVVGCRGEAAPGDLVQSRVVDVFERVDDEIGETEGR